MQEPRFCWICYTTEESQAESPSSETLSGEAVPSRRASSPSIHVEEWVHPCQCKGSTQWVHQSCLLSWINVQSKNLLHATTRAVFTSMPTSPDAASSSASLAGTTPQPQSESLVRRITGRVSRCFSSSNRVSYELCSSICCPQCKSPYVIRQQRGSPWTPILSRIIRFQNRILLLGTLGTLGAGLYLILWSHGFASLIALYGRQDAWHVTAGPMDALEASSAAADVDALPTISTVLAVLRHDLFLILGIPYIPVALAALAARVPPRLEWLIYQPLSWLYVPPIVHRPDGSAVSTQALRLLLPTSWIFYRRLVAYLCERFSLKLDLIRPLDEHSEDEQEDEAGASSESAESPTASGSVSPTTSDESPTPGITLNVSSTSLLPGEDFVLQTSLSSIAGALLFPFVTGLTSSLILRLFRPRGMVGRKPLVFHLFGPILRAVTPRVIASAYYAVAAKLHSLPYFFLNLLSGSAIMIGMDASQAFFELEKKRLASSRQVLNYPAAAPFQTSPVL